MKSYDLYSDTHALGVLASYAGRGSGQGIWNPTKIITSLRNLARWQSVRALLNHRTRLYCPLCSTVRPVVDYKPLANVAVLSCKHERSVSTMTAEEYADLVRRASSMKIRVVRNPKLGGCEVIQEEAK